MKIYWELKGLALSKTGLCSICWNDSKLLVVDNGEDTIYLVDYSSGKIESSIGIKARITDIAVGDVNGDSLDELLVVKEDGSSLIITQEEKLELIKAPTALVKIFALDINNDSIAEIFAFDSTGTLNIFAKGKIMHRIMFTPPIMFYEIRDFDNDGNPELLVIYSGDSYDLYSLDNFNLIAHKSLFLCDFKRARVVDLDSDDSLEILILRGKSFLSLKPHSGQIEELFELFYDKVSDFEVFDINHDGMVELIVLGEREGKSYVSILSIFGEILLEENVDRTLTRIYPADINGDGKLESIITSVYGKVVLLDEAGIVEGIDLKKEILSTYVSDLDADNIDEVYARTKHSVLCLKRF